MDRQPGAPLRCTGVTVVRDGELVSATASKEVILCAGSIGSPQLLQLSGIGPASVLQAQGIPVQVDLPGVGSNLQDHLQVRAVYKVNGVPTLNQLTSTAWGKAMIGREYLFRRSGPMSMAPSQLGAFTRSSADCTWPNIQYHVQPLSLDAFGDPLHRFPAFTASASRWSMNSFVAFVASPRDPGRERRRLVGSWGAEGSACE